jgi:hypothetical protein
VMKVYAVYKTEKDGSKTFCVAWPDVWNARHSVLSLDEELKLDHEWVEMELTQSDSSIHITA